MNATEDTIAVTADDTKVTTENTIGDTANESTDNKDEANQENANDAKESNNAEPENVLDDFIKEEFGDEEEVDKTFITGVRMIDDSGRGEGVGKKEFKDEEDEELGIYDDKGGDDASDTELDIERLREEKQRREEERLARERQEADARAAEARARLIEAQQEERRRRIREDEAAREAQRAIAESFMQGLPERMPSELTPRTDGSISSRMSIRTWSDPKFLQGLSLKEMYWKSLNGQDPVMTSMTAQIEKSINASRMALESREAMFRRAMSLLSARCTSVRQDGDAAGDKIGGPVPKYFYVTQDKPVPMEPLKAWRGYNGNIYFEPININPVKGDGESLERAKTSLPERPNDHARALTKPKTATDKDNRNASQDHRAESRQTTKSSVGAGSRRSSNRPGVYLDRQAVFTRYNDSIQEDLVWLEGQESTGSLAVRPKTYPDRPKDRDRDLQYNKERIRKGSVAHRLFVEKSKQKPKLTVSGGKFTPPNSLSPLLRTQTQYSLSSNRLTTNSPDLYHLNESKFPPLPRSAAKRESIPPKKMPYTRSLTITDDMKPFVKYSPDVVAKFSQPTNIC